MYIRLPSHCLHTAAFAISTGERAITLVVGVGNRTSGGALGLAAELQRFRAGGLYLAPSGLSNARESALHT